MYHHQEQTWCNGDDCQEQSTKDSLEQNSDYEDSVCEGVPLVKGQFCAPIDGYFLFFQNYPHSDTWVFIGHAMTKSAGVT